MKHRVVDCNSISKKIIIKKNEKKKKRNCEQEKELCECQG